MSDTGLVKLEGAARMLAEVRTVDDAKKIIDLAEAARVYARQAELGLEAQNHAAEIKLRAQRRAGEILSVMERGKPGPQPLVTSQAETQFQMSIAEIGIPKSAAYRWQQVAALPDEAFEAHIQEAKAEDRELTTAGMLVAARQITARMNTPEPVREPVAMPEDGAWKCIVIDPPWPMKKIERDVRPNQGVELDYPVMSIDEIMALPIKRLADPMGCHVYLWTTHKFLPYALALFTAWEVKYQCMMTWVKPTGMTPFSWMYNTEHVLFGRIGDLPLNRMGLKLSFEAPVTRHSEKPDVFYDRVIQASPAPRLEMFARRIRVGFNPWGNGVEEAPLQDVG